MFQGFETRAFYALWPEKKLAKGEAARGTELVSGLLRSCFIGLGVFLWPFLWLFYLSKGSMPSVST